MSTTLSMNEKLLIQEKLPYMMSGVIDLYSKQKQSVGIVLIHDAEDDTVILEDVVGEYLSFGVQKLYLINKDGSKLSDEIAYQYPNIIMLSFDTMAFDTMAFDTMAFDTMDFDTMALEKNTCEKSAFKKSNKYMGTEFSLGYMLNIAFEKINTDIVFLSWTNIDPFGMSSCLLSHKLEDFPLCVMPVFENEEGSIIPTSHFPKKKLFGYKPLLHTQNPLYPYSLFPFNGVGIYNRKKFLKIGGFDVNILDLFGQLFEFGIRGYTNNMRVRLSPYFRVQIDSAASDEIMKNNNELYDLICIKSGMGVKLFHSINFLAKNIRNFVYAWGVLRVFRKKTYTYKHTLPRVVKEYW